VWHLDCHPHHQACPATDEAERFVTVGHIGTDPGFAVVIGR